MTAAASSIATYLHNVFGEQPGWIELWHGHTRRDDPGKIDLDIDRETRWKWYEPARVHEIVDICLDWARRHGNVYISTGQYDRPARPRNGGVPLPSCAIFADDGPTETPLPYSMVIHTSAGSRHPYYLLTEPVDPATRRELTARVAHGLKADKSGVDLEQLGRVPASVNTKHHKRYPVTLEYCDGPRYTPDQLREAFPVLPATVDSTPIEADSETVKTYLANLDQLVSPEGIPWRLQDRTCAQTHQILIGKVRFAKKDNPAVQDASLLRHAVIKGLLYVGYDDDAITAMMIHYGNFERLGGDSSKGSHDIRADIARILGKLRADPGLAHIKPTTVLVTAPKPAQCLPDVPRKTRARKDRPQRVTPDDYLAWCHATMDAAGQLHKTRKEAAAELGISVPTVDRLERYWREQNGLERFTSADRRRSWLAIYAPKMMIVPDTEQPAEAAPEVLSEPLRIVDARTREMEHTAPAEAGPDLPVPLPRADGAWVREPLIAEDVAADEWRQSRIGPLPKARPAKDRPPAEQLATLQRQLGKVLAAKRREKRRGNDYEVHGLERAAADTRAKIAALEAQLPMSDNQQYHGLSAPPADQLTLDAAPPDDSTPARLCSPPAIQAPPGAGYRPLLPNGQAPRARIVVRGGL